MSNWTLWSDVRTIALRDVLDQRGDFVLRRICRWYSKTFSTPLHEVEEMPLEYVLQHYFECMWEKLDADEIEEEKRKILLTEEEEFREMLAKDAAHVHDEEGEARALAEVQKVLMGIQSQQSQQQGPELPLGHRPAPPAPPQHKPLDPLWNPDLGTGMKHVPTPSNIKMNFADLGSAEFDAALDEDSNAPRGNLPPEPPRKPRMR